MLSVAAVIVHPNDLARVIDAVGKGAVGAQRIVERDVVAASVKEAVFRAAAIRCTTPTICPPSLCRGHPLPLAPNGSSSVT